MRGVSYTSSSDLWTARGRACQHRRHGGRPERHLHRRRPAGHRPPRPAGEAERLHLRDDPGDPRRGGAGGSRSGRRGRRHHRRGPGLQRRARHGRPDPLDRGRSADASARPRRPEELPALFSFLLQREQAGHRRRQRRGRRAAGFVLAMASDLRFASEERQLHHGVLEAGAHRRAPHELAAAPHRRHQPCPGPAVERPPLRRRRGLPHRLRRPGRARRPRCWTRCGPT